MKELLLGLVVFGRQKITAEKRLMVARGRIELPTHGIFNPLLYRLSYLALRKMHIKSYSSYRGKHIFLNTC